ncbi:hypothetical protein [Streptomyces sp. B6B3]|uniref:DUF6895 family protein n=1 Tax=Streptomyces sp. B6B3 TaxID=3153570 RepID=UPI00325F3C39
MSAADLERVLTAALGWLHDQRDRFRLPDDPTHPRHDRNATWRPLAELAQLSLTISRVSAPGGRPHRMARSLLDLAWRLTGAGEAFVELARREPHAVYPLELYAAFAEAGLHDERFEAQLRCVRASRWWRVVEREPTRTLAVLNAERRLGLPPHRDPAEAQHRTWLGGMGEPWAFTTRVGYGVTHHVFHVTNWGVSPQGLPRDLRDYLTLWLPAWLDCTVEAREWDLTGEFLVVAALLPDLAHPADAWDALCGAQAPDGSVAESDALAAEPTRWFHNRYHSTLVTAFAAALAHARARAEAHPVPAPVPAAVPVRTPVPAPTPGASR